VKRRAVGGGALKAWNGDAARALLDNLHEQIAVNNFSAVSSWPLAALRSLMAAIETYRRLVVLAGELSDQLARIAPPRPAPRATPTAGRDRMWRIHACGDWRGLLDVQSVAYLSRQDFIRTLHLSWGGDPDDPGYSGLGARMAPMAGLSAAKPRRDYRDCGYFLQMV
jgi:hypothetical protein